MEQVWNTDESIFKVEELMAGAGSAVLTGDPKSRAEYLIPGVQDGGEAARLVTTVWVNATRLPLFFVLSGSGNVCHFRRLRARMGLGAAGL